VASRSKETRKNAAPSAAPGWQTAVTVLLILHLFCLGLGLAANSGGGKSLLAPALRLIPVARQYLQLLWMDISYDVHLASPLPADGTHTLEIDVEGPASESDVDLPAVLPPADMQPRIRRHRYHQLASNVAYFDELFAENSDLRTDLPLAIAEQWLRDLKAPHRSYIMRCRREPAQRLPKAVERAPSKPREGGPRLAGPALYETQTITIHLVWNPDEGKYQASRAEATGLTSEVMRPAAEAEADGDAEESASEDADGLSADDDAQGDEGPEAENQNGESQEGGAP
jgi:hypothetical protein